MKKRLLRLTPFGTDPKIIGNTRLEYLIYFVLFVTVVFVFLPTLDHDFINYDDMGYILKNNHVRDGLSWSGIQWAFSSFYVSNWHPLTWISHMLDCQLFKLNPGGHHLTNLLLHAANSILLFFLLRTMTGTLWRSSIVAALFAVHPLHVESVAWIAERKDVLSTFFFLLTLLAYFHYTLLPTWKRYVSVIVLFAFGLMAKPMLVTLPFVLLLLDYWPLNRMHHQGNAEGPASSLAVLRRLVLEKAPLFLLSIISCVITLFAQKNAILTMEHVPLWTRLENAVLSYAKYLGLTILPKGLAILYPYRQILDLKEILLAAAILIGATAIVLSFSRSRPYLPVGWFWYLGTLVPVIGIVQVGRQAVADRYTYIPLIGIFIVASWGGYDLCRRFRLSTKTAGAAVAAVLLICTMVSHRQIGYWQDSITLFQRAIDVTSGNYVAHHNLGSAWLEAGKLDKAAFHLREALNINPLYPHTRYNLAVAYFGLGKLAEACDQYRELIRVSPAPDYRNNFAVALMMRGDYEEASNQILRAIKDDPNNARAYNTYGVLLIKKGDPSAAAYCFEKALRIDPNYQSARMNSNLMVIRKARKRRP